MHLFPLPARFRRRLRAYFALLVQKKTKNNKGLSEIAQGQTKAERKRGPGGYGW